MGTPSRVRAARREGPPGALTLHSDRLLRPLGDNGPHLGSFNLVARKVRNFGGKNSS
jgi:hypothetical protein